MNSYQDALALMGYPSVTNQYAQGIQALLAANRNPFGTGTMPGMENMFSSNVGELVNYGRGGSPSGSSNLQQAMPGQMQLPQAGSGGAGMDATSTISQLETLLGQLKGAQQQMQFPVDRGNYAVSGDVADQIRGMSGGLYANFMNEMPEGMGNTFEQPGRPTSKFNAMKFKGLEDGKLDREDLTKAIKKGANDYDIRDLFRQARGDEGTKISKGVRSVFKDVFKPAIREDKLNRSNAQMNFNRNESTRLNAMNYQQGMFDALQGLSSSMLGGNNMSGTGYQQNQGNFSVDPMEGGAYANPQAGPNKLTFPGLTGSNYSGNFSYQMPDSLMGGGLG